MSAFPHAGLNVDGSGGVLGAVSFQTAGFNLTPFGPMLGADPDQGAQIDALVQRIMLCRAGWDGLPGENVPGRASEIATLDNLTTLLGEAKWLFLENFDPVDPGVTAEVQGHIDTARQQLVASESRLTTQQSGGEKKPGGSDTLGIILGLIGLAVLVYREQRRR